MIDAPTAAAIASVCTVLLAGINVVRQELVARRVAELRLLALEERRMLAGLAEQAAFVAGAATGRAEVGASRNYPPPPSIEPQ